MSSRGALRLKAPESKSVKVDPRDIVLETPAPHSLSPSIHQSFNQGRNENRSSGKSFTSPKYRFVSDPQRISIQVQSILLKSSTTTYAQFRQVLIPNSSRNEERTIPPKYVTPLQQGARTPMKSTSWRYLVRLANGDKPGSSLDSARTDTWGACESYAYCVWLGMDAFASEPSPGEMRCAVVALTSNTYHIRQGSPQRVPRARPWGVQRLRLVS